METISFTDLIKTGNKFGIDKILIPKIQRSYAQGRPDHHAAKIRERFLASVHMAINAGRDITLDFIYGNICHACLVPLDGQQRLTTLWLLHWYAAKKECRDERDMLAKFTYDTRYSARDFMAKLVAFSPSWKNSLSAEIRNQGWFPMDWINDPSVSSMLTMIDAIDAKFGEVDNLWEKLGNIRFHFLSVDEMNLTDDIYIKMNSRGKPLTDFEHFKAEFLKRIKEIADEDTVKRISRKIDIDWTDMLWPYRGSNNIIDDEFLRYFLLICHLITYRRNRSVSDIGEIDSFGLIENIFVSDDSLSNLLFMERAFDCWVRISQASPIADFFHSYLSYEHESGKSIPLGGMDIDVFGSCLAYYPFERQRPNGQQMLTTLYAFLIYLMNQERICDSDFRRRLRIVLNLQKNSGSEVVDNPKGDAGNRMPAILAQVERIICHGIVKPIIEIDGNPRPNFSVSQLKEEKEKLEYTTVNPLIADSLFELEDHELLNGRVEIVGVQNQHLYSRFIDLFSNCSYDAIDCALLASGNYSQRKNNWCIMLGSADEDRGKKAWYTLFHPTENVKGFAETARLLRNLLEGYSSFNDDILYGIAKSYTIECSRSARFDWRYYYLNYGEQFRIGRYGKYTQYEYTPYEMVALYSEQKESSKATQCFLRCIGDKFRWNIRELDYNGGYLLCFNDAFALYDNDNNEIKRLIIPQDENGIDTVDRIIYFNLNFNS